MQGNIDHVGFRFLEQFWPDLYESSCKAERAATQEPDVAAIRLRAFTETMVTLLLDHLELGDDQTTQFDRLVRLEKEDLLDRRLLSKFHTIRRLGNNAAHNRKVTPEQVETMLEDAWSLGCWFCRFMRPDVVWFTPPRGANYPVAKSPAAPDAIEGASQPLNTATMPSRVLAFPTDRIQRVREDVAKAMAQIDPRARPLRTRISMLDAFSVDLNEDQRGCLSALSTFLDDREQRLFLLKGDAGTGKTFLVKGITEYLAAQGRSFQLLAPTGRAAKVMLEKTDREARTLHASIYDYSGFQEYRDDDADALETFKIIASVRSNKDQANAVYIVDEASLLSDIYAESDFYRSGTGYLLQDLITYVGFGHSENDRKIIFVGDPAQLPPVGMSSSPALDPAYLQKHFDLSPMEYDLKEVVRQKAESGVLRNVKPLRDSLAKGSFSGLSFEFGDDVTRIRTDEVLPLYMAGRAAGRQPIVITHSNAEAATFNRAVREQLHPNKTFVTKGDVLIVTANAVVSERFVANGEFVEVTAVETVVDRRTVTMKQRDPETKAVEEVEVVLTFRDVDVAITSPDGTAAVVSVKLLDDHLHGSDPGLSAIQQRALYIDFLKRHPDLRGRQDRDRLSQVLRQDPYFNALRAKFGYAVTCHKAQGGEWTEVFVSCPMGQNPRTADYFRWLYTAMTRSSHKLHLINPPEVRIKAVGEDWWSSLDPQLAKPDSTDLQPSSGNTNISPQESFRSGVLARVRSLLTDSDIGIDDIAHHPYQEAYYLSRGVNTGRVNISYNSKYKITSLVITKTGEFEDELRQRLAPLLNQAGTSMPSAAGEPGNGPALPFLKTLHDRLVLMIAGKRGEGTRVPSEAQQMAQSAWFANAASTPTGRPFYCSQMVEAEELLFAHLPWIDASLGDEFVIDGQDGQKSRTRRRIYVKGNPIALEISVSASHPEVRRKATSDPIKVQMETVPGEPWRNTVHRIQPREGGKPDDVMPEMFGIIDHVNRGKALLHFVVAKGVDGTCPMPDFQGVAEAGQAVAVRMVRYHTKKGLRTRTLSISPTAETPGSDVYRPFHDTVEVRNGLGFTSTGIFIPPDIVSSARIADGVDIEGMSVINFDKKRGTWGWKAISVKPLIEKVAASDPDNNTWC